MPNDKDRSEERELWSLIPKQSKKERGETYFRLSLIAFEKAQYSNSLALAENACECFKENCDAVGLANANTAVAFNLYQMKQTREAIRALLQAVMGYAKSEDEQEWQYREHLARWFKEVEEFELARNQIQKIIEHTKQNMDDHGTAYFQCLLGQAYCDLNECQRGIDEYKQSRDLCKELRETKDVADVDLLMARCFNHLNNPVDAEACAIKALSVFESISDFPKAALAYSQLGLALNISGAFERALSALENAHLLILKKAPIDFYGLHSIQKSKVIALRELGRENEAEVIENRNRVIAETLGIGA
jgi:tetratricopeptide (TPR) repeat protein